MPARKTEDRNLTIAIVGLCGVFAVLAGAIAWWTSGTGAAPGVTPATTTAPRVARTNVDDAVADATPTTEARARTTAPPAERTTTDLEGRVVDQDGLPVGDASIALDGKAVDREIRSATDGTFAARGLPFGVYQVIVRSPDALSFSDFVRLEVDMPTVECVLRVERGALLVGDVVDDENRPIAGARVIPWRRVNDLDELDPRTGTTTDAGGRFQLRGLAERITFASVSKPGFVTVKARIDAHQIRAIRLMRTN